MTAVRRLSALTTGLTLALLTLGGAVRATGSGLGCPDWPTCHGRLLPPLEFHAVVEYSHRMLAALVGLIILSTAIAATVAARRDGPQFRGLRTTAWVAVALVVAQGALGGAVVARELDPLLVTLHLALAMTFLAVVVALTVRSWEAPAAQAGSAEGPSGGDASEAEAKAVRVLKPMALAAAAGTFFLMMAGAWMRGSGRSLVFRDWPLMDGRVIPPLNSATLPAFVHRVLAALLLAHVVAMAVLLRRHPRRAVRVVSVLAAAAFVAQVIAGAGNVLTDLEPASVAAHVGLAAASWACLVALVAMARETTSSGGRAAAYLQLTKPRIVVLLLITTVPAMVLAAGRMPSLWLVAATLAGGMLTAGSANSINQFLERDIDRKMQRTRRRPLPDHRVAPRNALIFGIVLGVAGFAWLVLTVNLLSALLAASAIGFYVGVYTLLLKRSTPQNIVIGGAAGAVPVLVGWAAVKGSLAPAAWIMFAIIFVWTPPHFWALAMKYRDDYAAAGVPMMPVARGVESTSRQILTYTVVLVPVTLLLKPVGSLGLLYGVAAAGLGAVFVLFAVRLWREQTVEAAMKLFRYSISYLALLFASIAADRLLLGT
ncbi:MAG TPA: heme o synthase [Actinomycetota bacterium]|nr:heme o synthase [Actinomycetota bacterium]